MLNAKMLQQVQQMQARMMQIQENLKKETVETSAGGGAVSATVTGDGRLVAVRIAPEAVDPEDVEMLQDMIVAAVNDGITRAQQLAQQRMASVMPPGMKLPGM